jgi:hypothetical protein
MTKRQYDHNFRSCSRTYATLLIFHEAMQPDQITAALGLEPDDTARRGEPTALARRVPRNLWARGTYDQYESRDLRFHVDKILDELRGKEDRLNWLLKRGCEIEISCFWESASGNGGPELDVGFLKRLTQFPVSMTFDIWLDLPAKSE